ncbi:MAG: MBL fold metallo-hydrolase [Actinomycetota bacterium]|nr:MBL fold metallo-hydrolase [Actinomycetota bacterium]
MEIVPGIHRIESDLGPRFMCQYVLVGDERIVLIDTGIAGTPDAVIEPYLGSIGTSLEAVDEIIVSHADVDHCGGNRSVRTRNRSARFSCHELDRRWIESNQAMLAENYRWYEPYGFGPDAETIEWITTELGGDCPIDWGLRGGETLRLGGGWRVQVLHLPGHTLGHIGLWDERSRALILIDAVLHDGIYDRAGNRLIPPRYYDARAYTATIRSVQAMQPDVLLTAHFPVMEGSRAIEWLDASLEFTHDVQTAVDRAIDGGITDLWELTRYADERVGPYPESMNELGASVRAHAGAPKVGQR